ncbi:MAG: RidA family protein [Aestuariivirgaceae bacterium]
MTQIRFENLPTLPANAGYSDLTIAGGFAYVAGKVAADRGDLAKPADIEEETQICMDLIGQTLVLGGMGFRDILKVTIFMKNLGEFDRMNAIYRRYFAPAQLPARTTVGVADIVLGCSIEIECVACTPRLSRIKQHLAG